MADDRKKFISFDPTIHAGHVITALTIVFCAVGSWYSVQADISHLKGVDAARTVEINEMKATALRDKQEMDRRLAESVKEGNQAVNKLRDDMQGWFMTLNDKLDRKADKR